eukprot:2863342-Ditylum_brightwellii.AAC.1
MGWKDAWVEMLDPTLGLLQHLPNGKGEDPETRHVVIPLLDVTSSGFKPRLWKERVASMLQAEGESSGPVMCDQEENLLSSASVEDEFHVQLARVQLDHPHLIDSSAGVTARNLQNRWQSVENKQGSRARL